MSWRRLQRQESIDRTRLALARVLRPAVLSRVAPVNVAAAEVPGEPIPYAQAIQLPTVDMPVGGGWGRQWGTTWFHVTGTVPASITTEQVWLRFTVTPTTRTGFGQEALVWKDGVPLQGLSPNHELVRLPLGTSTVDLRVEAAANPDVLLIAVGNTEHSPAPLLDPQPDGPAVSTLAAAELVTRDSDLASLCIQVEMLLELAERLPEDDPRGQEILAALTRFVTGLDPEQPRESALAAQPELTTILARGAHQSAPTVISAAHAHIDTAWLWPLRETVRKCARTFSTALSLIDEHPSMQFLCSQAAQHAWMRDTYPALFERMKKATAAGRFHPLGSMWVEADCNVPSGESLVRQILLGKRFFLHEYGIDTTELWLPDVFGYSAALPQIMSLAGITSFFTQKLAWNRTNTFPHHTFWWEGLDGTRVLTHFSPADTYNGDASASELMHIERNGLDHVEAPLALYPYGFGDGGGGATREQLARLDLAADLEGLPKVRHGSAQDFFTLAHEMSDGLETWVGELYLEMHRGTYTTQSAIKRGNRLGERNLRELELWSSRSGTGYPTSELQRAWEQLCLLQFHDIIPGSSINRVNVEAQHELYALEQQTGQLVAEHLQLIANEVDAPAGTLIAFNASTHPRSELVEWTGEFHWVDVPGLGFGPVADAPSAVQDVQVGTDFVDNGLLRIRWDTDGTLSSIWDHEAAREVLPAGGRGNLLEISRDLPTVYEAWDLERHHRDSRRVITQLNHLEVQQTSPHRVEVLTERTFGSSTIMQSMVVTSGSRRIDFRTSVDWQERQKVLQVAFPVDVHARSATFETQFGTVERPTHSNTSWDWARFETCAQRWADISEPGFGVALLNDCKYGYDVHDGVLRLSLLRSPTNPDPECDRGMHTFTYALLPHLGDHRAAQVTRHAEALNTPIRFSVASGTGSRNAAESVVAVEAPNVFVTAVKRAEDGAGLIVRLYEGHGERSRVRLSFGGDVLGASVVDLLERPINRAEVVDGRHVSLQVLPFQIVTLLVEQRTRD